MSNETLDALLQRMEGMRSSLLSIHEASGATTATVRGIEREQFVNVVLAQAFTPPFRFGTGQAFDRNGRASGQLDIVIEFPFLPSFPVPGLSSPRRYLAEGVAAVIEVKSNLESQWNEVLTTASNLALVERRFGGGSMVGGDLSRIPLFVVGYKGWRKKDTVARKIEGKETDGALLIDSGIFISKPDFGAVYTAIAPWALLAFIDCIAIAVRQVLSPTITPLDYIPKTQRKP